MTLNTTLSPVEPADYIEPAGPKSKRGRSSITVALIVAGIALVGAILYVNNSSSARSNAGSEPGRVRHMSMEQGSMATNANLKSSVGLAIYNRDVWVTPSGEARLKLQRIDNSAAYVKSYPPSDIPAVPIDKRYKSGEYPRPDLARLGNTPAQVSDYLSSATAGTAPPGTMAPGKTGQPATAAAMEQARDVLQWPFLSGDQTKAVFDALTSQPEILSTSGADRHDREAKIASLTFNMNGSTFRDEIYVSEDGQQFLEYRRWVIADKSGTLPEPLVGEYVTLVAVETVGNIP